MLDSATLTKRPKSGAAPMPDHELLFSRTDERGVILAANPAFQKIADFDWETLIGAPHKLVRHPDMPRALFHLLWHSLKEGHPIGAYVKNRTQDDLFYWVFATITPLEGGFVSIRIKPQTHLLTTIENIYQQVRKAELDDDLSAADSAELLVQKIKDLGYTDYQHFMASAMTEEVCARGFDGKHNANTTLTALRSGMSLLDEFWENGRALITLLGDLSCTLVNMRLVAARLEGSGGPISLMAQNYATVLMEARGWMQDFMRLSDGDLDMITQAIRASAFDLGVARVQEQAVSQFAQETLPPNAGNTQYEMTLLSAEAHHRACVAMRSITSIATHSAALDRAIQEIRRSCAGLNSTRLMCKAEAARLQSGEAFASIVETLDNFQQQVEACADSVTASSTTLRDTIDQVCMQAERHNATTEQNRWRGR